MVDIADGIGMVSKVKREKKYIFGSASEWLKVTQLYSRESRHWNTTLIQARKLKWKKRNQKNQDLEQQLVPLLEWLRLFYQDNPQDNQLLQSYLISLLFSVKKVILLLLLMFYVIHRKCYPYDPSKVKGVNLEAKPGMIIQAAPTTASPKRANPTMSPQRGPSPPQKGHKGQIPPGQKGQRREDDERGKSKSPSSPKAGKTSVLKCDYSRQVVGSRFFSGTES